MKTTRNAAATILIFATLAGAAQLLRAQQAEPIKRNMLLQHDIGPGREGVMITVEFAPGAAETRHTHPGELFAYILDGALSLEVEGKPTVTAKAGESLLIEAGKVHAAKNISSGITRLVAVLTVDKGKPRSTPAK